MRFILLACAGAVLSACNTPCPPAPAPAAPVVLYCEDGSVLRVTFTRQPNLARVDQAGYPSLTLPIGVSGSGYRYAAEGAELRGQSSEATWTRPGAAETICRREQPTN